MGYRTKIQMIKRKNSEQYFINFPMEVASAMNFFKGQDVEWEVLDKDSLVISKIKKGRENDKK